MQEATISSQIRLSCNKMKINQLTRNTTISTSKATILMQKLLMRAFEVAQSTLMMMEKMTITTAAMIMMFEATKTIQRLKIHLKQLTSMKIAKMLDIILIN